MFRCKLPPRSEACFSALWIHCQRSVTSEKKRVQDHRQVRKFQEEKWCPKFLNHVRATSLIRIKGFDSTMKTSFLSIRWAEREILESFVEYNTFVCFKYTIVTTADL